MVRNLSDSKSELNIFIYCTVYCMVFNFFFSAIMANNNWKEILRTNYVGLSQDINIDDGLRGEMLKLVPMLFTALTLNRIWVKASDETLNL